MLADYIGGISMKHLKDITQESIANLYSDIYTQLQRKQTLKARLQLVELSLQVVWAEVLPTLDKEQVKNEEARQSTSLRMFPRHWRFIRKIGAQICKIDNNLALLRIEQDYLNAMSSWLHVTS